MRGVCGRQRHNPHNARRHIAQRWRRRFRKLRRKTRVRRGGDIRHQNVREIPGGPFRETVIAAGPDCPEISGRPADFITVAFRRGNRYMRPAGNAGKAERGFFPPRQWLHRRPKDLRRHRGRNTEQLLYAALRARRKAVGAASSSRKRIGENHIRAARKPAGSPEETVRKSKPPANMKKSGAGTGQAAQTATANDAGNLLIAQNLSAGARRIELFSAPFRVQAPKNLFDKLARTNLI